LINYFCDKENLKKSFKDIRIRKFIEMETKKFVKLLRTNLFEGLKLLDKLAIENNIEIWHKIDGYNFYEVSSKGRVRNIQTQHILKPCINRNGYYTVRLSRNGKGKIIRLHRLVAFAYLDNPLSKPFVDHINNDKLNNNVNNLRWAPNQENQFNATISCKNSSGVKGIGFHKRDKRWYAQIMFNKKKFT
jgi:hypothetical protein